MRIHITLHLMTHINLHHLWMSLEWHIHRHHLIRHLSHWMRKWCSHIRILELRISHVIHLLFHVIELSSDFFRCEECQKSWFL